jgi:hypothetical protein
MPPALQPDATQESSTAAWKPPIFDTDKFNKDGYLVIPNFLSPETVDKLYARVQQLLDDFSLDGHPMTKFSTGQKEAHVGDEVRPLKHQLMTSIS